MLVRYGCHRGEDAIPSEGGGGVPILFYNRGILRSFFIVLILIFLHNNKYNLPLLSPQGTPVLRDVNLRKKAKL